MSTTHKYLIGDVMAVITGLMLTTPTSVNGFMSLVTFLNPPHPYAFDLEEARLRARDALLSQFPKLNPEQPPMREMLATCRAELGNGRDQTHADSNLSAFLRRVSGLYGTSLDVRCSEK